jgi:hypothetical protein
LDQVYPAFLEDEDNKGYLLHLLNEISLSLDTASTWVENSWKRISATTANDQCQVSIRAFFPVWVLLYVLQFVLLPVIGKKYWLVFRALRSNMGN